MKQGTRDNLIYLAVGFGIVALIVVDLIYGGSEGRGFFWPSRFEARAFYTSLLLAYCVIRETRKARATVVQVLSCALFATMVHLAIAFVFRQHIDELPGMSFSAVAVLEMFVLVLLSLQMIRLLKSQGQSRRR